jgi:hypothetical protein
LCLPARTPGTALGIISFGWLNGTLFRRVSLVALQPLNHSVDARTLSGGERQRMALAPIRRRRAGVDPGNRSSLLIGTIHHTTLVCLLNRSIGAVAGSLQYLLKV